MMTAPAAGAHAAFQRRNSAGDERLLGVRKFARRNGIVDALDAGDTCACR
jgi:hypothetical protein